jgi:hypothetical protein
MIAAACSHPAQWYWYCKRQAVKKQHLAMATNQTQHVMHTTLMPAQQQQHSHTFTCNTMLRQ